MTRYSSGSPLQQEQRRRFYTKGRLLGAASSLRTLAVDSHSILPSTICLQISGISKILYNIGSNISVKPTGEKYDSQDSCKAG